MKTGAKIGLGVLGLFLAGGIGYAVYAATKPKEIIPPTGSGTVSPPPSGSGISIGKIKDMYGNLVDATREQFPLRIGMVGPNVKKLQEALKSKFGKTSVSNDGILGVKTWMSLKELGYVTFVLNTLSKDDFDKILAGESKAASADGYNTAKKIGGAELGNYVGL